MADMNTVITLKEVDYEQPEGGGVCATKHAWARVPPSRRRTSALRSRTSSRLLKEKNAVMVSHYYVRDLQDLAEETGGIVSNSLEQRALAATTPRRRW